MNILLARFSRTGHTQALADAIRQRLTAAGHSVTVEKIEPVRRQSHWIILARQIYTYPLIALALASSSFLDWWMENYPQPEDEIRPLSYPDVSGFDLVCIGGPKWAEISYPVARYVRQVAGLGRKPVALFGTFGGPPLPVFEIEMLFRPLSRRVEDRGARVVATLGLSSGYHELYILPIMKLASRRRFGEPLEHFHFNSDYGRERIAEFCAAIEAAPGT